MTFSFYYYDANFKCVTIPFIFPRPTFLKKVNSFILRKRIFFCGCLPFKRWKREPMVNKSYLLGPTAAEYKMMVLCYNHKTKVSSSLDGLLALWRKSKATKVCLCWKSKEVLLEKAEQTRFRREWVLLKYKPILIKTRIHRVFHFIWLVWR